MGPAIGEAMAAVAAQGIGPAGPDFSHHFQIDPARFDFEIGVPATRPVTPVGRAKPSHLPATKVARTTYRGPYEGLGSAWSEFCEWISANGLTSTPDLWEYYVTGPESSSDPTRLADGTQPAVDRLIPGIWGMHNAPRRFPST